MAMELLTAPGFEAPGLIHAFTTRTGGVSEGPYASLNLSWSRGDDKARVEENRQRVSSAMGGAQLVFLNQVHGAVVHRVERKPEGAWSAGEGDALITSTPGLALCAQTADCTPVLLHDPVNRAIAAIHAGWRGVIAQVIPAAIRAMSAAYGTRAGDLRAAIGPAVSRPNYRVGPEVLAQFEAMFGGLDEGLAGVRDAEGGAGLDVSEACARQLVAAGLAPGAISRLALCTFAEEDRFFSCRRAARDGHAGAFGGQCAIIALR
ncbi:peptidoglycan editing factor PgeF [Alkalicaulis satelles]|uniref:Purine nucleoside phosphorylase n=1 Tax=Alkalicaulis satelles TaxID=2609175 RepID=A0A5M6ZEL0_9PROT|nr:peptidoglycan editing factor PgeF [Alkalicaulis satelles]KAA5802247.1 peptidoglycan editing factor PgeF [Alkalicaulis satelles]